MEGVDWGDHEPSARTLHVWRWVVDAEANLKAARNINDKLRRQHDEEKGVRRAFLLLSELLLLYLKIFL